MCKTCLVVLIGIPGAGKTQFCLNLLQSSLFHVVHICFDDYLNGIQYLNDDQQCSYQKMRDAVRSKVEELLNPKQNCGEMCEKVRLILLDDNMYYKSMRRTYFNLARKYNVGFCQIYIQCNLETASARNNLRSSNKVPDKIISDMLKKLEPPSEENSWEKYFCVINSENNFSLGELNKMWALCKEAAEHPVETKEEIVNTEFVANIIQEADLLLRKIVSQKLKDVRNSEEDKKAIEYVARKMADKKKEVLNFLKNYDDFASSCKNGINLEIFLSELMSS